ncbi:MAG TPA: polysaccharide biosynthesis tyrosine autokinase [Candidatus Acidoferrales bacterium]|nr:polysaccharide biosynthesis tyrosine autokinase [Candidatus Acidoferrales bacterium]
MDKENQIQLVGTEAVNPRSKPMAARVNELDSAATVRAYWRIIQKRRRSAILMAVMVFGLALLWTIKQKPMYEAKALLEIEQENPNIVTVRELFQIENVTGDYIETQYMLLQSDSLARDVIQQLHLDKRKEFNSGRRLGAAADEQRVLQNFEERLNVIPIPRSRLIRVTFDSQDPKLAASVVNTLGESYIEQSLKIHWDATQKATKWLGQQLDGLKIKLKNSEDELQQYAQAKGLLYLENDKGETENAANERLQQLQNELTQAQAQRYQAESVFRLAEAGDYSALPGVFDNKVTQDLSERLADLEQKQAQLAPSFKPGYPEMKAIQSQIKRTRQLLEQQRSEAERHVADEYFAAVHREDLVKKAFAQQETQANVAAQESVQYNILKREVDTNKQLYEGLLQRLKEAGVSAGLKASNVRVVDPAVPPAQPVSPRMALDLAFGLLLGLAGGAGLACVQERVDNTVKSPDDVAHFLHLPILGLIPRERATGKRKVLRGPRFALSHHPRTNLRAAVDAEGQDGWIRIDGGTDGFSDLREAFRVLRTSILLSTAGRPPRSLAIVSAEANEGKTTVCCNLALSLAQLGKRVLVIDGDIRCPGVQDFFHISGSSGLVNHLAGLGEWRSLVQVSNAKGLDCLICGPEPPNPGELLSSERMEALIKDAMNDYNFVLVDAPPVLNITDGRILAAVAEGTVLVVKAGVTSRERAQRAESCMTAVGAHVIGAVLNDVNLRDAGYYHTGYYERRSRALNEREKASA